MVSFTRRATVSCLLLLFLAASAMAQTDGRFVIKKGGHYLAHVNNGGTWVLQDATTFSPECIWFSGTTFNPSGTNHNYYFYDGENYRFLAAPLQANGTLSLSESLPSTSLLRNTDQIYYFFDWDSDEYGRGIARGHQHAGITQEGDCVYSWNDEDNECWQVYWVEYDEGGTNTWKLTSESNYHILGSAARFRNVAVTVHDMEITSYEGGLGNLSNYVMDYPSNQSLSISVSNYTYSYIPTYTAYVFEGGVHNYYNNADQGTNIPDLTTSSDNTVASYEWTITGEGAEYLSFASGSNENTSNLTAPTLYYNVENTTGHKTAILTLTVTYSDGATQVRTATVTVKTHCQNPTQTEAPVVTFEGVTVSWVPTAEHYKVYWQKQGDGSWNMAEVGNVNSYTITDLEYETNYIYKVSAFCNGLELEDPYQYTFTTMAEPSLLVYGAVFGGGRMADVGGKTEVVVINCENLGAVFGGNDIAGTVRGDDGSSITLGVNSGDTYDSYGTTTAEIKIGDVYGGGNGYYAYNGSSFVAATGDYTSETVAPGASVKAMTQSHEVDGVVWTNAGNDDVTLSFPSITKTVITVNNDYVKVDSIFGGAKNAFLTANSGNGSTIAINGGTIFAVFGGNNFGGTQGYGKHHIDVTKTTTNLTPGVTSTATTGYGRDFGIRYLFGGGNKVYGSTTELFITGGQIDTIFGGGNSADVYRANVTVNCAIDEGSDYAFGNVYSDAIESYSEGTLNVKDSYSWNGSGVYNVDALFGGNNKATMSAVPILTLTSGSIGTVYGGGNAGDMLAQDTDDGSGGTLTINEDAVKYGTHVELNSPTMLVDYLYGGCQMSNVDYSTWVEIKEGHVGTVYGGCNVSGDVGSTRINPNVPSTPPTEEYQAVQGGTYVVATGGTVYKNLFAGSNGFYHCNNGIYYIEGLNYDPQHSYVGLPVPTHNETHVVVSDNILVKGNVYAGGNLACVGFLDATAGDKPFPWWVGLSSVRMSGGTVKGNVFGGGNMASIYGSNEVQVSGGIIEGALYGGNDRTGQVAQFSNRVLPERYEVASDNITLLTDVHTYISLTGAPNINTVFGGGNGDYVYDGSGDMQYCHTDDQPIQTNTFVDINIEGGTDGGHIGTVYGGGDGVTVTGFITVFLNIDNPDDYSDDNVETIFGGNNKGDLADLVPDIILLHGQVNTVYGGCNQGAMAGSKDITVGDYTYEGVGSYVRLRETYQATSSSEPVEVTAVVSGAVYGGCRMNGVTNNTLVLIEGGDHNGVSIFGGSDISGIVGGTSRVVITGGIIEDAYGGGNGNYDYTSGDYEGLTPPFCSNSRIDIISGTADNLYAGGYAGQCGNTYLLMEDGTVNGNLFGGGNMAGVTNSSTVDVNGGTVLTGVYGGCNNSGDITGNVLVNINQGNIGTEDAPANIHGGGYGLATTTSGDVTVNIGVIDAASVDECPIIYGDVYGGSALGNVNDGSSDITTVNFLNGTLHGNVYGGGLGDKADLGSGHDDVEAMVYGQVIVNIGSLTQLDENCFIDLRGCSIYGCNNTNGSPQDNVTVNVYNTAHTVTDLATYRESDATFAIDQVFGGGNQADYLPENGSETSTKTALVHVFSCDNTIRRVFGGGNAAASTGVATNIEGGRFYQIFGGGNGEVTAANIGLGGVDLTVTGGVIHQLFGGSNSTGTITGNLNIILSNEGICPQEIDEFFGGGNLADITGDLTTTILCSDPSAWVHDLYGGSNMAGITGDVTLNIYGGDFDYVYGGSKGDDNTAANIDGNTVLNLYGGDIDNAFGGCNINGNITGTITVNVNATGDCNLNLINVYGASNLADYSPENADALSPNHSPVVNVFNGTVQGNVFGAGKGIASDSNSALVTANPQVNIQGGQVNGNVYGGGEIGSVSGITYVNVTGGTVGTGAIEEHLHGSVYGGGLGIAGQQNLANVTATYVTIGTTEGDVNDLTVKGSVFGGGENGHVLENTQVFVKSGTVGTVLTEAQLQDIDSNIIYYGNVYGGGRGIDFIESTSSHDPLAGLVYGSTNVSIQGGLVRRNVYGGGSLACVGTISYDANGIPSFTEGTGVASVNISGGQIGIDGGKSANNLNVYPAERDFRLENGFVFGSGRGMAGSEYASLAYVNTTEVTINGTAYVTGSVFGGGENGHVKDHTEVTVEKTSSATFHNDITAQDDPYPVIGYPLDANEMQCDDQHPKVIYRGNVYGGGRGLDYIQGQIGTYSSTAGIVLGYTEVEVTGGTVYHNVYGGGSLALTGTYSEEDGEGKSDERQPGDAYVTIKGNAVIGTKGMVQQTIDGVTRNVTIGGFNNGSVYGSARGVAGTGQYAELAYVKNTHVTIGGTTSSDTPEVLGSVFGGGENGHVKGNTNVSIVSGTVGTNRATNEEPIADEIYRGNVYGGGRGVDHISGGTLSTTAGIVEGNTNVSVTGGTVLHNVYGGGSLACVGNSEEAPQADGSYLTGLATVSITGGQIGTDGGQSANDYSTTPLTRNHLKENGFVFGSGRGVAATEGSAYINLAYVKNTDVTIGGTAYVTGSVFGGGENGHVRFNSNVTIDDNSVVGLSLVAEDLVENLANPRIIYRGNVYGGGRGIDPVDSAGNLSKTAGVVKGNTTVTVNGGTVHHNVYGGGSMASVGTYTYDSQGNVTSIADETGISSVLIQGGIIGMDTTLVVTQMTDHNLSGINNGQVFGGGRGEAGERFKNLAYVDTTYVYIHDGQVYGAVFGGGCNGHVKRNTYVVMDGGTVGHSLTQAEKDAGEDFLHSSPIYFGNVYGGGRGIDLDGSGNISPTAGLVYGNTKVDISGGRVHHDVYGGGSLANVGTTDSGGTATVNITGTAIIGTDGKNAGFVYGSGRGIAGAAWSDMAFVKETFVNIGSEGGSDNPQVRGSVFGGGSNGHVTEDTQVNLYTGTIGTMLTAAEMTESDLSNHTPRPRVYRGNVYGGGRGVERDGTASLSTTAGRVYGNTNVNINGGKVYHNVYGGGSLASVGTFTMDDTGHHFTDGTGKATVTINNGEIGMSGTDAASVSGATQWHSGLNNGQVYGSGRGEAGTDFVNFAFVNETEVNVNNGTIYSAVFGGGANGHVQADTYVTLSGGTIGLNDATGTYSVYRGNVYGGGRGIDLDSSGNVSPTAGRVYGNTNVSIEGGNILHNVFGGGSLASVGTTSTSGGTTIFTEGTGTTNITVQGGVIGINAEGNGHVFGSGRGYPNPDLVNLTYVNNTNVNILDGATVKGSVFGSGDNGQVFADTHVTMRGGTIGTTGGAVDGNLFGSGRGVDTYTVSGTTSLNEVAGLVHGNTYVVMSGGNVKNNIYGGGYMASVTGNSNVEVTGAALVGVSSNTSGGKVFGACCGVDNVSGIAFNPDFAKIHGNTIVNIHGANVNILSNVYGGGKLGAVGGNTNVTIAEATLNNVYGAGQGVENDPHDPINNADVCQSTNVTMTSGTVNGSVYGGGEFGSVGIPSDPTSAPSNGAVSTVNIEGGHVLGSAFGGGNLGFNKGATFMNLSGDAIVDQNIFGGAYGSLNTVYVAGLHTVNMRGGAVYGNVYGGSRNADDALDFNGSYNIDETGHVSIVNISGGHAVNHVFASGYFGKAYGSVFVFIGTNAIMNAPNNTFNASDPIYNEAYYNEHNSLIIDRDVWAGADYGDFTAGQFGDPTISGKSNIYVDGLGYDTENAIPTGNGTYNENDFMVIRNSIYGSGTSCDAAHEGNREIMVRNYGKLIAATGFDPNSKDFDEPYTGATRDLFSIQRADNLVIDNSNINFIGQGLVNSFNATEKYTIHEFNTVHVANNSSIIINKPLEQIKKLGSYTCPDVYASSPVYTVVNYSDLVPTDNTTWAKNKFRVNQGTYVSVVYRTTTGSNVEVRYGELEGYFFMMTESSERALAFARPKQSADPGNTINGNYDNPDDGGFVSYHITYNTYDITGLTVAAGTVSAIQIPYENHAPMKAGELYFRVWRYSSPEVTHTLREGVLNAIVQTGAGTSPNDFYRSEAVRITLPPSAGAGSYYRIQILGGAACNITYGTEYIMKNAGLYEDGQWMYTNSETTPDEFVYNPDPLPSTITGAQETMQNNPNNAFGLVAVPTSGLELAGNEPWLICNEAAEEVLRHPNTLWYNNTNDNLMPAIDFYLTYSNAINGNNVWDPVVIFFEQFDQNHQVIDEVEIRLTITTITDISQTITTETYALMFGDAAAEDTYTTKILLPPYNVQGPDFSEWTLEKVEWVPESSFNQGTMVEYSGASYEGSTEMVAMTINPSLNFDNGNGWHNNPLNIPLIDINSNMMSGSTNPLENNPIWLGETDGRNPISFNAILYFDASQQVHETQKMGTVELTMKFTNKMGTSEPQTLRINIEVWRKGSGNRYYIDGIHGSISYDGTRPDAAKPTLANILYFTNFTPGDVIYIVDKITVTEVETREWNGQPYNKLRFYRYDGDHECWGNESLEPHYDGYNYAENPAYLGPLLDIHGKMTISSSLLDGSYIGNPYHPDCQVESIAPMINVADGGELTLLGGTIYHSDLENNYNSGVSGINAGAINIESGGTVKINNYVYVEHNYVENVLGGGMYLEDGGTLLLSDLVTINNNNKVDGDDQIPQNVYLENFNSNISIGTMDPTDLYQSLNVSSKVGITKTDWNSDYYYMPVLFGDDGSHLTNLHCQNIVFDDQGIYRPEFLESADPAVADPEHHLFFVHTWTTEVRNEPSGFNASAINTPEELAWAISLVNGLNGQTATAASNFTITDDIDMSANIWDVIGNTDINDDIVYSGVFEGNGHTISGIHSQLTRHDMGMFGKTENATISNLIVNTDFEGGTAINLGSLVGEMAGGNISNVETAGTLQGKTDTENIGGMVGKVESGTLSSVFAVNTFLGGNATIMGGLVGTNGGNLYNAYSNIALHADNAATTIGGLAGVSSGCIENCYVAFQGTEPSSGFGWFANTNTGSISYCYSPAGKTQYTINGTAPTGHGNYGEVKDRKAMGYLYDDNAVTLASGTTEYVHTNDIDYSDNHLINWNGLLWTLNKWVSKHSGYTPWFRPTSANINSDLPVLAFPSDNSLGTSDGRYLQYGSTYNSKNGIDALLTAYNDDGLGDAEPDAYLFLYGNATGVTKVPTTNVKVTINEDVVLKQVSGAGDFTATVGITFDNSCKSASDFFNNQLLYDWHMMSSPLTNASIGTSYDMDASMAYEEEANLIGMSGGYFPDNPTCAWDFYAFYEPEYHWINLKRSTGNHWHYDEPHGLVDYENETMFEQGKGYMMAIEQDSYLSNEGKLNHADFSIPVTYESEMADELGFNLLGNPYQSYLDMEVFLQANPVLNGKFYVYVAENNNYVPYAAAASPNPATPSAYLHPHQAFFVKTSEAKDVNFIYNSMATTTTDDGSYFRDRPCYPLVNLFATDATGMRDLVVIEFNRPELGGATKLNVLNNAKFELSSSMGGKEYSILFTPEGTQRVPVRFKTNRDGVYTLTWETYHGIFSSLRLVDNLTGANCDMLSTDHYTFESSSNDYASRFYITFACVGIEENENDAFAYFDGSEWVLNGKGRLEVVDMLGRVLRSEMLYNEQNRINLNGLAKGMYLLRIVDNKKTWLQKIVVR